MYNNINIIQWNCRSLKPKWPEFTNFINANEIHIALIQETWLAPSEKLTEPNYNIFRIDRQDSYGGVAIIVHKDFSAKIIKEFNTDTVQVIGVEIKIEKYVLIMFSVYCTNKCTNLYWCEDIFHNNCNKLTLIGGDMNAHHPYWGSNKSDKRGKDIFNYYTNSTFILLNDKTYTTTPSLFHLQSVIDLMFVNPKLYDTLTKWEVMQDPMGSDHFPIKAQFNCLEIDQNNVSVRNNNINANKKNFKKADWKRYKETINNEIINNNMDNIPPEQLLERFSSIINMAAQNAIPLIQTPTHRSPKFIPKPWWNEECAKAVAQRRLAFTKYRKHMSAVNYNKFLSTQLHTREVINQAKKLSWNKVCEEIGNKKNIAYAWKVINKLKNKNNTITLSEIQTNSDLAERFMKIVIPDYVPHKSEVELPIIINTDTILEKEFLMSELKSVLQSKKKIQLPDLITLVTA